MRAGTPKGQAMTKSWYDTEWWKLDVEELYALTTKDMEKAGIRVIHEERQAKRREQYRQKTAPPPQQKSLF